MPGNKKEFSYINKYENIMLRFSLDETALVISTPPEKVSLIENKLKNLPNIEVRSHHSRGLISVRIKKGSSLSSSLFDTIKKLLKDHTEEIHIQNAYLDHNGIQRFFSPNTCVVQFEPNLSQLSVNAALMDMGLTVLRRQKTTGLYTVQLTTQKSLAETIEALNQRGQIKYAGPYEFLIFDLPNPSNNIIPTPNDSLYSLQWALENTGQPINGTTGTPGVDVKAREAWTISSGNRDVVVVVADSGAELGHEDLIANLYPRASSEDWNFVDDSTSSAGLTPQDDNGHGSHVAGIVAAASGNNTGIAGLAYGCQFIPLKHSSAKGTGTNADSADAINTAVGFTKGRPSSIPRENIKIILNCSFGTSADDPLMKTAIVNATRAGILVVAAAGNNGVDVDNPQNRFYPACYLNASLLAVAASDQNDVRASFSNFGSSVTQFITAPGVNIASAYMNSSTASNRYVYLNGTSMAAPMVSAAAALLWSSNPQVPAYWIAQRLMKTVDNNPNLPGQGRLNAFRAINSPSMAHNGKDLFIIAEGRLARFIFDETGRTLQRRVLMTGNSTHGNWNGFTCMTVHSNGDLYIIQDGLIHRVNLSTERGVASVLSNNRFDNYSSIIAHGDGNIYVVNGGRLHRVDSTTGQRVKEFPFSCNGLVSMAALNRDEFFLIKEHRVHRINVRTDNIQVVGDSEWYGYTSMAPYRGKLSAITGGALRTIDPTSGNITLNSVLLFGPTSMTSAGDNLYIIQDDTLKVSYPRSLQKAEDATEIESLMNISQNMHVEKNTTDRQKAVPKPKQTFRQEKVRHYSTMPQRATINTNNSLFFKANTEKDGLSKTQPTSTTKLSSATFYSARPATMLLSKVTLQSAIPVIARTLRLLK